MLQKFNEKNRDLLININGKLLHRDEAGISPFDSAVQGGDAVWEGLRVYDGKIFRLAKHLERLRSSALALAFAEIGAGDADAPLQQIEGRLAPHAAARGDVMVGPVGGGGAGVGDDDIQRLQVVADALQFGFHVFGGDHILMGFSNSLPTGLRLA